ncbi:MAG: outer membrane protein transport protein [Myxococcota bacterium]|nr:outer membrane protein transport protein [Myxococcota bacterium]
MLRCLFISLTLIAAPAVAFAGNVFNSGNHSAEYARTLNRNASTDVDAAVYNAAGTIAMPEGFHLGLTNHFVFKLDNPSLGEKEFRADDPVLFYPTLSLVYNAGNWSAFIHAGVPAGGGSKNFKDGHPVLSAEAVVPFVNERGQATLGDGVNVAEQDGTLVTSGAVKGTSTYYGLTVGGAYQALEWLSIGLGLRFVQGEESTVGAGEFDLALTEVGEGAAQLGMLADPLLLGVDTQTKSNLGFNPILSLYSTPVDGLGVALQYQFKTPMEWERTYAELEDGVEDVGPSFYPSNDYRKDLPAIGTLGVSYMVTKELRAELNYTHYFNSQAVWEDRVTDEEGNTATVDRMEPFTDGWESGLALEYDFGDLVMSVGAAYQHTGSTLEAKTWLSGNLNTFAVATGATYTINDNFEVTLGAFNIHYISQTKNMGTEEAPADLKYSQSVQGVVAGMNAHF